MASNKNKESDNKKREEELKGALLANDELKSRYSRLQSKYSALMTGHILEKDILSYFRSQLDMMDPIDTSGLKLAEIPSRKKKRFEEEAILPLSDMHLGEIVIPGEIMDLNCYNLRILEHRLDKMVNDVKIITERALSGYRIGAIHIPLLGDIVSGTIHEELLETNEFVAVEMCLEAQRVITETILKLRQIFPKVYVYCVSGNHGRLTKKMSFKRGWNNWDYLVGKQIEMQLQHVDCADSFIFDIPKSTTLVAEIGKHKFLFDHGHGVRIWNGIPYYGLKRFATNNQTSLLTCHRPTINHFLVGHFHKSSKISFGGADFFMNGCLIGTNEYSMKKFSEAVAPTTWFFGIEPDHQEHITFMYELNRLNKSEKW